MTSTEITNASKIMLGSTEVDKVYIGSTQLYCPWLLYSNGYACVDLGLPSGTRWATVNVGAISEISNGDYYQYGKGASKYADTRGDADYVGTETPLNISVDTVRQTWGGDWHMPTYEQCQELINNCTWTWGRKNGKYGYIVSNNGKYIFLPVAGRYYNNSLDYTNEGYYWIAKSEGSDGGRCIRLTNSNYYTNTLLRKCGFSVRGVLDVSAHALPAGYTELEYISSSSGGNQYIDLGVKLYETLNTDYDIAMKFNIASGNANQAAIFACQDSDNDPWPGTFVRVNSSSGKVIGRYTGGTAKDNTLGNIGTDIELPVQTPPNKNVTNLNNNNSTHQYGTSLFCAFVGGTNTPARYCNAKLYYFKLFVEGALVRDLIPCKNSNNVVGMYDVVNNVFYTSPNGNAFVAGPPVNLDYVTNGLIFHLDGINKGTGADWVDLIGGIQLNTRTGYECTSTLNSWSFPGDNYYYLSSTNDAWSSIGGSDDFTIEVCYNNLNTSARTFLFGFGGSSNSKYPIFYHDGTYITWIQGGYKYNASSMTGNAKYTVSLNNDSGLVNGQLIQKTSSTDYWDEGHTDIRIGSASRGGAASAPAKGDIYSIRIYNRRLSQSEQLQNQRVDNIRFNLGLSIQ